MKYKATLEDILKYYFVNLPDKNYLENMTNEEFFIKYLWLRGYKIVKSDEEHQSS